MEFKDYYTTLGVSKTATDKEIKQAFRKLARKYHPDVNPGDKAAEAKFKEVNNANKHPTAGRDGAPLRDPPAGRPRAGRLAVRRSVEHGRRGQWLPHHVRRR